MRCFPLCNIEVDSIKKVTNSVPIPLAQGFIAVLWKLDHVLSSCIVEVVYVVKVVIIVGAQSTSRGGRTDDHVPPELPHTNEHTTVN